MEDAGQLLLHPLANGWIVEDIKPKDMEQYFQVAEQSIRKSREFKFYDE